MAASAIKWSVGSLESDWGIASGKRSLGGQRRELRQALHIRNLASLGDILELR
jgi:hypothetical protein